MRANHGPSGGIARRALAAALPTLTLLLCHSMTSAVEPRVAGFDELLIYEPSAADIEFLEDGDDLWIETPSTLHIHRFYYNGNKEYQGPIIAGGPTVVVAKHPRTGERMYLQVELPAGAPIIAYNKQSITYVYSDRRVVVAFSRWKDDKATIRHKPGIGLTRRHAAKRAELDRRKQETARRIPLNRTLGEAATTVKDTLIGAAGGVTETTSGAVERVSNAFKNLPLINQLQSAAKQRVERGEAEAIRQADAIQERGETEYLPTIR